jgi:hypothetical protein
MERVRAESAPTEHSEDTDKPDEANNGDVTVSVESYLPENVPVYYSDGLTVIHTANEFIISFLQTQFPLAGSKDALKQVKSVRRKCVTQIIVSPAQFEAIAKVFQDNLQNYLESFRKP